MTLADLIIALREACSDRAAKDLVKLLEEWRQDFGTVDELRSSVEKYVGNVWMASGEDHRAVCSLWADFESECIDARPGMTLNERLYCFDLLDAWDQAESDEARARIRHKIEFSTAPELPT